MVSVSYAGNWIQLDVYPLQTNVTTVRCNYIASQTIGCVFTYDTVRWLEQYTVNGRSITQVQHPLYENFTGKLNENGIIVWYIDGGKIPTYWKRTGNACNK